MEKWLLIGSGGREYVLAQTLAKNEQREVIVAPGNPMMDQMPRVSTVNIDEMDFDKLVQFAKDEKITCTVVGPEQPLSAGIVDAFQSHDLTIWGPSKQAAQLESSKAFAKRIMQAQGVATAAYHEFADADSAIAYIKDQEMPIVIKANGLAGGKGVMIAQDKDAAVNDVKELFEKFPQTELIIEDYLSGQEFSLIVMANGTEIVPMPIAQDHKRQLNDDKGPNTGGMGAYSPCPQFSSSIVTNAINDIIKPVLTEMKNRNQPFTGFLYAGLMQTADGTKVIEFNVRMGDPETQVILPQLESDFGELILSLLNGDKLVAKWQDSSFYLGTVLAAKGYPKNHPDHLKLPQFSDSNLMLSYAGVENVNGQMLSHGGRIMMVSTKADNLKAAQQYVNNEIAKNVDSNDYEFRTDIGSKAFK